MKYILIIFYKYHLIVKLGKSYKNIFYKGLVKINIRLFLLNYIRIFLFKFGTNLGYPVNL